MIELDGSYGSGGGQIIRTSLALSALTGKPFHIANMRAKRSKPGLAAQHLACVLAVSKLCNAKVQGASIGSTELWFEPGKIEAKKLKIDVGTAGSIPLVLQAVMPALTGLENVIEIDIIGGTDTQKAPSIDYTNNVLLRLLNKMGYNASLKVERRGFFPKGGGLVYFRAEPMALKRYDFLEQGRLNGLYVLSIASEGLRERKVAERQLKGAIEFFAKEKTLASLPPEFKTEYAQSHSYGTVITSWLETEKSIIGASALGELKKRAEIVGQEAAQSLILEYKSGAVVDVHASDQLLPYLALTGGSLKTSGISEHMITNAFVIEKFLPVKFEIDEKNAVIKCQKI